MQHKVVYLYLSFFICITNHKINFLICVSVTTIGRGNGDMLVLLDLSAAFDTIDHDNLFVFLKNM